MSGKILWIVLLCGLFAVSVVLQYRETAAVLSTCSPRTLCVPDVKPPDCVVPDCDVVRPLLHRACEMWEVSECL